MTVAIALVGLGAVPAAAEAGWTPPSLTDPDFDPNVGGPVNKVKLQSDGKILIAGTFTSVGGVTRNRVARVNANGTLDTSFIDPDVNGEVKAIAIQSDGKIVIGGFFTQVGGEARDRVARLNADGSLDAGFDAGTLVPGVGTDPAIWAVEVQSDGKILIGGDLGQVASVSRSAMARLNADGSLDTSFASTMSFFDRVLEFEIQADNKILVGAQSGTAANRLFRVETANGALDTSFVRPNPNASVRGISAQSDGKILAAGEFTEINGAARTRLARLNSDGTLDTSLANPNINGPVFSVNAQPDGKILAAGAFTTIDGAARTRLARLESDGTLDTSLANPNINGSVNSANVQPDGRFVVGGSFTTVGGVTRNRVARLFPQPEPAPPTNTSPPTISGIPEVGQTLTADNIGNWTGYPEPDLTYQWERCTEAWTGQENPSGTTSPWFDVVYGGATGEEQFVAVGNGTTPSRIMTSPDGLNWTVRQDSAPASLWQWRSVTYGAGLFVAVGDFGGSGDQRIITSPDGITWSNATSVPSTQGWQGVAYGGGKFVAVSFAGPVITSTDGLTWSTSSGTLDSSPKNVGYGNGRFVVVSNDRAYYSTDGNTFTETTTPGTGKFWRDVVYGDGKWVAVSTGSSSSGSNTAMFSEDEGETWTQTSIASKPWFGVTYGNGQFTAAGFDSNAIATSSDGTTWTSQTAPNIGGYSVAAGAGTTVAVGDGGGGPFRIATPALSCTDISGADDPTYTLTDDDEGKRVRVKVTGTNSEGSSSASSAATPTVQPSPISPPVNTVSPTVEGTAALGAVLSADEGIWSGNPTPTYSYQWQRCDITGTNCVDIPGAGDPTYTQTRDDVGFSIRVKVTATNSEGSSSAFSEATDTVIGPPANTTPPSISGDPKVGETLTADPGEWSAYPEPELSYQWQRCDADGTNCVDIDGATEDEYTATEADTGKKLRVKVTATNEEGESTANSSQTAAVAGAPVITAPPVASGPAQVGQTLTTTNGIWTAQPAPTFTYQWLRCDANGDNCVDIPGATSSTYRPTSADAGSTIRAQVIATNSEGSEGAIGNAIGPIAPAPAPSGKPKIKVAVKAPKKVKAGKRFTIRVKTTNRAKNQTIRSTRAATPPTTATKVKTCVILPRGVFVVNPRGGKVSGRNVCWTKKSLAAGRSASYSVVVRSASTSSGIDRITVSARGSNSSGATAKTSAKSKVKVVKPKPKPKPEPPTG
jgi:uncharacterized delta-60 repeat protein